MGLFDRNKTFRPNKKGLVNTTRFDMHKSTIATLGAGDMSNLIAIPPNMNENEWLAVSTEDFFEKINLLYGNVMEVCTAESCPTMSAGPLFEYLWQDNRRYKKATALSAPEYVDCLMEWIQEQMEDESLFPTDPAVPFPKDFKHCQIYWNGGASQHLLQTLHQVLHYLSIDPKERNGAYAGTY